MPAFLAPLAGAAISAGVGLLGKKRKAPRIDTASLLSTIRSGSDRQREIASGRSSKFQQDLTQFGTDARGSFGSFKTDATTQIAAGKEALSDIRNVQGSRLGRTLQENAFRPVRGATEFIRQNLGSTRTGAANEALSAPVIQAQQQFGQALNDLTSQLQQGEIDLTNQANAQKLNLIEQELGFEQGLLSTIFQQGTAEDKALAAELIQIQSQQTANELQVISLGNLSGLAADSANNAARADRDAALFGVGGQLAGTLLEQRFGGKSGEIGTADIKPIF